MTIADTELHEKIKSFITKLDRMESRVKEVETVMAKIPKLEATLSNINARIDTIASNRLSNANGSHDEAPSPLMRNLVIGLVGIAILVMIGLFLL